MTNNHRILDERAQWIIGEINWGSTGVFLKYKNFGPKAAEKRTKIYRSHQSREASKILKSMNRHLLSILTPNIRIDQNFAYTIGHKELSSKMFKYVIDTVDVQKIISV